MVLYFQFYDQQFAKVNYGYCITTYKLRDPLSIMYTLT